MISPQAEHWLKVAANLRVDRKGGIAPHKPLLLLVVAELAERGELTNPLPLSGELTFQFLSYSIIVAHRRTQKPEIYLPFFHLNSDGVWTPLDENGNETTERRRVEAVQLNSEFFDCLHHVDFREQLRRVLIAKYFVDPAERAALYDLVGLPIPTEEIVQADVERYKIVRGKGREARFALTVIPAYNYTCALFRFRLTTVESGSIIEAAHIHQWAKSRNDDPQNGIALCKNAHWAFDAGLWTLDENYKVLVAQNRFDESGNPAMLLKPLIGQQVLLPSNQNLWPDKKHLHWHRTQVFGKSRKS
jgi:putative restriction endonuclease